VPSPPQKPGPRGGPDGDDDPRSKHATDVLSETCTGLEQELEEVKAKYEMYFLGVERMEPARRRDELKRNIARLKTAFTRNTGLRFRIQALHARYLAYERLWLRAARQKEEGTYRRDLFKARRRAKQIEARPKQPGAAHSEDVDVSDFGPEPAEAPAPPAPAVAQSAAPPPLPARRAGAAALEERASAKLDAQAPADAPSGGLSDSQMRSLYDDYLAAKKRCNEDTSKITYDSVASSVAKQIPKLMSRFRARELDFKVVIKDGKAILKAVPRT
jgi:type IV secretory pathway VirB10-like protein